MALDTPLANMFTHTVTLSPATGEDGYGKRTYGPGFSARAYIDAGTRETTGHFQEIKTSRTRGHIMVLTNRQINLSDKIEVPAVLVVRDPEIIEATPIYDDHGDLAYWELGIGDRDRS